MKTNYIEKNNSGVEVDPATLHSEEESQVFDIFKTDDEKRLVFGWANIAFTADGEQIEDLQHDIIDTEDLEEAVYKYVLEFRDGGEEHIPTMRKKASLVESVMFTKEKMKAMGIPEGIVPEGWWIGFYVKDDDAWEKVKDGTYQMFSIEGKAIREPVADGITKAAYDEWLENNLDEFESEEDERDFANWKSEWGRARNATDVDIIDEIYAHYRKVDKADRVNGCGVLVVRDGKILTGTRIGGKHGNQICGPGGHIEAGETHEEAAIREAREEFGIECKELVPLGILDNGRSYGKSAVFLCTEYEGEPATDEEEMTDCRWRTPSELEEERLFYPFELSLDLLADNIEKANPYHDERGRFTTKNGGGAQGTLKIVYTPAEQAAISDQQAGAEYLLNASYAYPKAMEAYQNGTACQKAKEIIDQKYKELQDRYDNATAGQKKLMEMTPDEVKDFIKESTEAEIPSNLNAGSITQRVAHQLDMNDKPTVLSREEYEKVVAESPSGRIYRGVHDNGKVGATAEEIAEMTVHGEQTFLGSGIHSDGIYFSTKAETAGHFTSGGAGVAMEACISPKARVISETGLDNMMYRDPQGYAIGDKGTYALYKGYNAIKTYANHDEEYFIALDRTALVFPKDYKADVPTPGVIHLKLLNKAMKDINGEELGKIFNAFAFVEKPAGKKIAKSFFEIVQKFNPYHDAKGRFSTSNGFATFSADQNTTAGRLAIERHSRYNDNSRVTNVHRAANKQRVIDQWKETQDFQDYQAKLQTDVQHCYKINYNIAQKIVQTAHSDISRSEIHSYLTPHFKNGPMTLPNGDNNTSGYFQSKNSMRINQKIRDNVKAGKKWDDGFDKDDQATIATMEKGMKPLSKGLQLRRNVSEGLLAGVGISAKDMQDAQKNPAKLKEISDKLKGEWGVNSGYSSAGYDFSQGSSFSHRSISLIINAPKGTKAFVSPTLQESEVVLARNTKLRYTGNVKVTANGLEIEAVVDPNYN